MHSQAAEHAYPGNVWANDAVSLLSLRVLLYATHPRVSAPADGVRLTALPLSVTAWFPKTSVSRPHVPYPPPRLMALCGEMPRG